MPNWKAIAPQVAAAPARPCPACASRRKAPCVRKSTVAKRIRNGTSRAKVLSLVRVSSTLPSQPPSTLTGTKRPSHGLIAAIRSRKP